MTPYMKVKEARDALTRLPAGTPVTIRTHKLLTEFPDVAARVTPSVPHTEDDERYAELIMRAFKRLCAAYNV
jgi:hypothetical protein